MDFEGNFSVIFFEQNTKRMYPAKYPVKKNEVVEHITSVK